MSNAAVGAAAVSSLSASVQGPVPPLPPLVEAADPSVPTPFDADSDKEVAATAAEGDTNGAHEEGAGEEADGRRGVMSAVAQAAPVDSLARATRQVEAETDKIKAAAPKKAPPLVSMPICTKAAKLLNAMSCSLVTQVSGYPEGCECRMKTEKCPAVRKDLGFTGVSPSIPLSPPELGGVTVINCMYWQWLKPQDRSKEAAAAAEEVKESALSLVKAANANAEAGAKVVATGYYAMTPPPLIVTSTFPIPGAQAPVIDPIRFMSATRFIP